MGTSRRSFLLKSGAAIVAAGITPAFINSCSSAGDNGESGVAESDAGLANLTRDVRSLGEEDFAYRLKRLGQEMDNHSIDALFIEGGTNMRYFKNLTWGAGSRVSGVLLGRNGKQSWVSPSFELARAMELIPSGEKVYTWEEHESPYKLIGEALSDMGYRGGTLGVCPNLRSFVAEGVRRDTRCHVTDGSPVTWGVRSIKSEKEIEFMDLANKITKNAYSFGFNRLEEGMSRSALSGLISQAHSVQGASGGGGPWFGFTSAFPHGTRQRRDLHEGDVVLVDGGCPVEGFRSDVTRTIVFGKPSDRQREVHETVLKAQKAAHKAIRPGVTCGEIDRVARKVIEDAGFGPGYKYFSHRLGHGIGMDGHEHPNLVMDSEVVLKPGMVFSNEPGIYIYGEFGVRIEDCFVVTEDGARILGGMTTASVDDPFGGGWH